MPVLRFLMPVVLGLGLAFGPAMAEPVSAPVKALSKTLQSEALIAAMVAEGKDYGRIIEDQMFPGAGGAKWAATVSGIYDAEAIKDQFDAALERALSGDTATLAAAEAFFGTVQGQKILTLEVEARKALADEATKEAARVNVEDMIAAGDPRMNRLRDFAEANDLIEMNVASAMNAQLAFYQGMAEAGALGPDMTEEQILSDVWSQEPQVRADTEEWLFEFLALAYGPMPDEELASYQAFSETAEGQKLNRAMSDAFEEIFVRISKDMGREAAKVTQGQDI